MYDFHVSETTRYCTDHEEPCPLPCPGCDADCDPSFMVDTKTYACDCKVCNGQAISAPAGAISGTPKRVRDLVHNYVAMTRNPAMSPILAQRGIHRA